MITKKEKASIKLHDKNDIKLQEYTRKTQQQNFPTDVHTGDMVLGDFYGNQRKPG